MAQIATRLGPLGVAESGGAATTPIVFLHGVGSDKSVWRRQIEHFSRTRRALAFDFPGYAESAPVPDGTDRDRIAEIFIGGLDALDIHEAHVCGLSMGGVLAIAMHAAAPERCASLIIADSFARHPDGEAIYQRSLAASSDLRTMAEARVNALLVPPIDPALRSEVVETMAAIDPAAYRTAARAVWLADQAERARAIDVPSLVLVGSEDPVTPPALSRELAGLIPGARYAEIPGASHLANLDRPGDFNSAIERFLSEAEAGS